MEILKTQVSSLCSLSNSCTIILLNFHIFSANISVTEILQSFASRLLKKQTEGTNFFLKMFAFLAFPSLPDKGLIQLKLACLAVECFSFIPSKIKSVAGFM